MKLYNYITILIFTAVFSLSANAQALNFDGVDDYVAIPYTGSGILKDFTSPHSFTIEVRFQFAGSTLKKKIAANNAYNTGFFIETTTSGELLIGYAVAYGTFTKVYTQTILNTGTWYTCALVYDQANYSGDVYVNGVYVETVAYNGALFQQYNLASSYAQYLPSGYEIQLANSPYWSGENGNIDIDYFRIWDDVRTASEIASNHLNEVSCSSTNLLLQYKMDDGVAGGNNSGVSSISDCTSNNYNGTLHNFAMNGSSSNFSNPVGLVALPVELTYFEAMNVDNHVDLIWQTASEKSNEGFEIEKSKDGVNWETLDFVAGHGTTQEIQNYSYTDVNPFQGDNYYRLKQIDFDGMFEYSEIVYVATTETANAKLKLYPTLVQNEVTVENGQGTVIIYNSVGQPVKQLNINDDIEKIDVNGLPTGNYIIQIEQNGKISTDRFMKM